MGAGRAVPAGIQFAGMPDQKERNGLLCDPAGQLHPEDANLPGLGE